MSALDDIRAAIKSSAIGAQLMKPATLRTIREGAYDPANPTIGPAKTTTDYKIRGLALKYGTKFRAPTESRSTDFGAILLVASLADPTLPEPGDHLLIAPPGLKVQIEAKIVRVREIDPSGSIAMVDCKTP